MRKWHISIGHHPNVLKDYNSAILNSCVCIHSTSEEWTQHSINIGEGKKGQNRIKNFDYFKNNAELNDMVFLFCKGKIRAKGIYNGEIIEILSKFDAEVLCPSLPTNKSWIKEKKDNFPIASFRINIKKWVTLDIPLSGAGRQMSLYEINENDKNIVNYSSN